LAKDDDNLAGSFETDNSAGLFSGFLAEEDEFDRHALWRLGSWGVGAVAAVIVAVMANQSQLSLRREQIAAADLTRQAQQVQMLARDSQSEARRLASAIDTLNGDRDRLYSRVTTLEQGLDSVTGAIARQGGGQGSGPAASAAKPSTPTETASPAPAVAPVATTQAAPAAVERPASVDKPPATVVAEVSPPATSTVSKDSAKDNIKDNTKGDSAKASSAKPASAPPDNSKTEGTKADTAKVDSPVADSAKTDTKPDGAKADSAKPDTAKANIAKPDTAKADIAKPDNSKTDNTKSQVASPSVPLVASKSIMAPPDPAATKLIEPPNTAGPVTSAPIPEVVATAPAADEAEADEAPLPKVAIQRTEFGVDLGSANSVNGLRALWRGLLKSRGNAPLVALRPIIVVKEATNGLGMQLRLVAGPLNDAGAAARICATMTENKRPCETTIFDGQRLSIKADDPPPAAAKPVPHHRGYAKRAAAVVVEEPKKPEPKTISSWFGRKGQ
jgi:hypothetical protein